jgi:hypothetical protein
MVFFLVQFADHSEVPCPGFISNQLGNTFRKFQVTVAIWQGIQIYHKKITSAKPVPAKLFHGIRTLKFERLNVHLVRDSLQGNLQKKRFFSQLGFSIFSDQEPQDPYRARLLTRVQQILEKGRVTHP